MEEGEEGEEMRDYLDTHAERHRQCDHDEEVGQQGQDQCAAVRRVWGS